MSVEQKFFFMKKVGDRWFFFKTVEVRKEDFRTSYRLGMGTPHIYRTTEFNMFALL